MAPARGRWRNRSRCRSRKRLRARARAVPGRPRRRPTRGRALPPGAAKSERPSGHANAGRRPAAAHGATRGRQASALPRALSCSTIARPPDARDTTSAMLHERHARRIRLGSCIHSPVAGRALLTGVSRPSSRVRRAPGRSSGGGYIFLRLSLRPAPGRVLAALPGLHLGPGVAQAHRAVEHQPPRR